MESQNFNPKNNINIKYKKEEVESFMNKIKSEFYSYLNSTKEKSHMDIKPPDQKGEDNLYFSRYMRYIQHEFNSTIVNMIIYYINIDISFPEQYNKEPNFIGDLIILIKYLFMNEIEVACFTILLENIGWSYKNLEKWMYFKILGIIAKKICGSENDISLLIETISRNYPRFKEECSSFINDSNIIEKINEDKINIKQINKRFILLKKPKNTFCQNNFINFHGLIDQIIKTTQSYCKDNSNFKKKRRINKAKDKIVKNKMIGEKRIKRDSPNKVFKVEKVLEKTDNQNLINFEEIKNMGMFSLNGLNKFEDGFLSNHDLSLSNSDSLNPLKFNCF